jgi:hypothetical protein
VAEEMIDEVGYPASAVMIILIRYIHSKMA